MVLMGMELFFYKDSSNGPHEFMHFLKGCFVKRKEPEDMTIEGKTEKVTGFPLKLVFSKKRARVVFFETD